MMKTKYILPLLVGLLLFSCNSENGQETTIETDNDTVVILTTYNSEIERKIQTFEINPSKEQEIKGEQGTVVTFPTDCFGKVQGKVRIELIECYSIQDMIFNRLSTQATDGKLLESDGMIYLNALNEKGDTLEIKQGMINVQMPTKKRKEDIQIFEGVEYNNAITWNLSTETLTVKHLPEETNNTIPKITEEEINYIDKRDSLHQTQPKTGQSKIIIDKQVKNENFVGYVFQISRMGWINCDKYLEGETQNLLVNVGKGQENVSLYLVLDKYNSNLIPTSKTAIDGQMEFRNVPVSESLTLVALATKGDEIYFGMANHPTHEGTVNCPELKPVTRQELTDLLLKKFGKDIWNRPLV